MNKARLKRHIMRSNVESRTQLHILAARQVLQYLSAGADEVLIMHQAQGDQLTTFDDAG